MSEYYQENENHSKSVERGASLKKTIKENKFYFVVLILLFFWPPIAAILDVNKVENGAMDHSRVIFPVGTLYNLFGYWPAILFYPLLFIIITTWIVAKFIIPKK